MRVKLDRILCTTDFSGFSNYTIPYGIALAKEYGSKLFVCHVIELPFAAMYGEVQLDPIEQQNRMVNYAHEQLSKLFESEAVEWEPVVTIGHTSDEIARLIEKEQMNLVISATHGRSGLKRLLLGSVTERLMRTVSCPLLIVHGKESGDLALPTEVFRLQRILVGHDFSKDSDMALKYALSMAQEFEAELHLAHVVEPPVYQDILVANGSSVSASEQSRMPQLIDKLKRMIPEEARNWCTVAPTLLEGKADEELTRYAEQNDIDLIALGVRGHGLVETLFVGSTTDRVARRASCPVLSVRAQSN